MHYNTYFQKNDKFGGVHEIHGKQNIQLKGNSIVNVCVTLKGLAND